MKKKIMFYTSLVIFAIYIILNLVLVFKNPDMTEIRLLMVYWKEELALLVFGLCGVWLLKKSL